MSSGTCSGLMESGYRQRHDSPEHPDLQLFAASAGIPHRPARFIYAGLPVSTIRISRRVAGGFSTLSTVPQPRERNLAFPPQAVEADTAGFIEVRERSRLILPLRVLSAQLDSGPEPRVVTGNNLLAFDARSTGFRRLRYTGEARQDKAGGNHCRRAPPLGCRCCSTEHALPSPEPFTDLPLASLAEFNVGDRTCMCPLESNLISAAARVPGNFSYIGSEFGDDIDTFIVQAIRVFHPALNRDLPVLAGVDPVGLAAPDPGIEGLTTAAELSIGRNRRRRLRRTNTQARNEGNSGAHGGDLPKSTHRHLSLSFTGQCLSGLAGDL
ncbi:hypothetical protein JYK04_07820 [Streptomyces nojiriensis]|nr:hypothetical protein JYK04_07820 [Streptomyces nojiriensis]